jgi:hypothetical protein
VLLELVKDGEGEELALLLFVVDDDVFDGDVMVTGLEYNNFKSSGQRDNAFSLPALQASANTINVNNRLLMLIIDY